MRKTFFPQIYILITAMLLTAGHGAWAANATYGFAGAATILDGSNNVLVNGPGPGERTPISGEFTIDSVDNSGFLTFNEFGFAGSPWITTTATFSGGSANQLFLDYDASWSGSFIEAALVWDATGFFGGTGAIPASDSAVVPANGIGPAPIATTTKEWNPLIGIGTVTDDGIGGSVISGGTLLDGYSLNLDMLSMVLQSCDIGGCSSNPLMPTSANPGAGFFQFLNAGTGLWIDPPASAYEYTMTDGSLFTDILNFPVGFDSLFQVEAEGSVLGMFGPAESVDFEALLGHGVSQFRITGINPETDSTDGGAFPIHLAFDTETASFNMQAIATVPVPAAAWLFGSGLLGLIVVARRKKT